jgi:hypothetical protein
MTEIRICKDERTSRAYSQKYIDQVAEPESLPSGPSKVEVYMETQTKPD